MKRNKVIFILSFLTIIIISSLNLRNSPHLSAQKNPDDDWAMWRHDPEGTGCSKDEVKPPLEKIWEYKTGDIIASSPAISGDYLYIGSGDKKIYCLDKKTGEKKWDYETGGPVDSSPALSGDFLIVLGVEYKEEVIDSFSFIYGIGKVHCLNKNTGKKVWEYETGSWASSSLVISDDYVYIESGDGEVYCLNKNTGEKVWEYKTDGWVWTHSSPTISDNYLYIGTSEEYSGEWADHLISYISKVYCLNKKTGEKVWWSKISECKTYYQGCFIHSSPTISEDYLYIGSDDKKAYCLNKLTGKKVWEYETGNKIYSSPAISDNYHYKG